MDPALSLRKSGRNSTAEADDSSRLKAQFLASLNYEIRTPLSGIMGMTDLLLETRLDEEQKDYVNAAKLCAENLLALFNATLEFSELSAGSVALEELEFDLPEAIRGLVSAYSPKAQKKGLKLTCTLWNGIPSVALGDAFRLRQLLSHLLDNAIKFTPKGEVEVRAEALQPGGGKFWLTAKVRDTGIGMEEHQRDRIFESFQQLDCGLSRNYSGLGLGLALAKKLADLMGGEIKVDSRPGFGSTFSATVPLQTAGSPAAGEPPEGFNSSPGRPGILLVDDNTVAQRVAAHALRNCPYEVKCVSSGPEALRAAADAPFALILMDLQMPGMDGLETAREIRRVAGYSQVPIVALTANVTDEYRRLCVQHGMQRFVSKPVEPEELIEAISAFLPI